MTDARITLTTRVNAPASTIFAVVSDPNGHVEIDGSGMLIAAPDAAPTGAVGDKFLMNMDREPLGDFPEMGKYQVENTVTVFEPDREFAWAPGAVGGDPLGHIYGHRLEPVSAAETDVTSYYDWSAISGEVLKFLAWPVVPQSMLEQSLVNLKRVCEK